MTLALYPTDQQDQQDRHEGADSGYHPNRRLVRNLILAIVAIVLLMVLGPDSVQYTMGPSRFLTAGAI
jgi:hypothetical protein